MGDSIRDSIETPYITNLLETYLEQMSVDTSQPTCSFGLTCFC